ncbi:hypothetical protein [Bacillus taeanensis]|uniref:Uncharacterized protein n=1 Tax=Bacillus taeanensis TaxID=273032 RepID=A0A366Y153_9BACI|nr:hypothetical protein [Bacillus taeanensis]RBW70143.1 hypothetical protein DS031_08105 [Bacillus taeanensis]
MEDMTVYIKEATKEKPIQTLEEILIGMNGVERALVDIEDGEVKITYNENEIAQDHILNRIKNHGLHIQ